MRNKVLLLFIVSLATSPVVFSQTKFSYGFETGINSSGMPRWDKYTISTRNDKVKETNMPVVRPVFGLWAKVNVGKHLFTNLALQYIWVGNKYHYHRDGNDLLYHETYTYDIWTNQTFQKFSIPIIIGYGFKIKNVKTNIFIGYKKFYYTKGSHYNKYVSVGGNHTSNIDRVQQLNPFDETQYSRVANKLNCGLLVGIGIDLWKKINLNLSYSIIQGISYGNSFGWEGYYNFYHKSDIALTIKYALK